MTRTRFASIVALIAVFTLTATSCLHAQSIDEEELSQLSAALIKVSQAVHTTVRYKQPDPALADQALVDAATAHNPALLNRFDGYTLKARQTGDKLSSVLVCSADGQNALAEDAGCTGATDWQAADAAQPCAFTLELSAVCVQP